MVVERLKLLRTLKGLTQKQFAEAINTSPSSVAMWETEKREPDNSTLKLFAAFFSVSTDYLMGLTDDPTPPREKTDEEKTDEEILSEIKFAFYGGMNKPLTKQDKKELVEMARLMGKLKREREKNNDETSGNH